MSFNLDSTGQVTRGERLSVRPLQNSQIADTELSVQRSDSTKAVCFGDSAGGKLTAALAGNLEGQEHVQLLSTVSPLHANVKELKHLALALIVTAEAYILSDDGEAYAKTLNKADVHVVAIYTLGTIHGFLNNYATGCTTVTMLNQTIDFLHQH
ncbi:hypothetical protein BDB00DRAFT_877284 [Zychaea mexicana]|uniref:uncharacterized protein n=1 Tax=Zychaea mexicana TaxID=64656 RepID=UPI0022FE0ADF|nr:uncharacterized protein BDB00DRAFT_877284 [Zychaea mexicana]KAI9488600.1 hypothetical protein BDB00DRAFT_877284 [Zychaea mexicana]